MTICSSWCETHLQYCVLKDVSIVGRVSQFSALRFDDTIVRDSTWGPRSRSNGVIRQMVKVAIERVLPRPCGFATEVKILESGNKDQPGWIPATVSVEVKQL